MISKWDQLPVCRILGDLPTQLANKSSQRHLHILHDGQKLTRFCVLQDARRSQSAERDQVPSTPRQPIKVSVPDAPKLGSKPSGALSIEQAPSIALQVGCSCA